MHAISPTPSPSSRSSCDGIIDAEFVERDASSAPPRIDPAPQRLALKMGPRAQPSLFDLPPELDQSWVELEAHDLPRFPNQLAQ